MAELEKVIKGLECCEFNYYCPDECPYKLQENCIRFLHDNCIAILKKHKEGHWEVLKDCSNSGIYCSECHCKIFDFTHKPMKKISQYCPHCGSKNEQFFRDGKRIKEGEKQ